jgi:hypothetical protein
LLLSPQAARASVVRATSRAAAARFISSLLAENWLTTFTTMHS